MAYNLFVTYCVWMQLVHVHISWMSFDQVMIKVSSLGLFCAFSGRLAINASRKKTQMNM